MRAEQADAAGRFTEARAKVTSAIDMIDEVKQSVEAARPRRGRRS